LQRGLQEEIQKTPSKVHKVEKACCQKDNPFLARQEYDKAACVSLKGAGY
jgi:hypothetical protein